MKAPRYDADGLATVLPSVARSLAPRRLAGQGRKLPEAQAAIVVLADGLGARLLRRAKADAPFLAEFAGQTQTIAAGFPTTTATSMGTFGTGLPPGAHGLTGYQVLDPRTGRLFNELNWTNGPDPHEWQPNETVFQRAAAADLRPAIIGPAYFEGSGLTEAALRGAVVYGAEKLDERVDAAQSCLRSGHKLVYLYWGEIDKAGHVHGVGSPQWAAELRTFDAAFERLATQRRPGTSLTLTADHGMVDVPLDARVDIAKTPHLAAGVRTVGGEMRALHLYTQPGATDDVLAAWGAEIGADGTVMTREELAESGWVGAVDASTLGRFGDVVVSVSAPKGYVDSRVMTPQVLKLLGQHGANTADELDVPFLHLPAAVGFGRG